MNVKVIKKSEIIKYVALILAFVLLITSVAFGVKNNKANEIPTKIVKHFLSTFVRVIVITLRYWAFISCSLGNRSNYQQRTNKYRLPITGTAEQYTGCYDGTGKRQIHNKPCQALLRE